MDTCNIGNSLPSGEKATDLTEPVWPSNTTCLPSGEKATELTEPVWPSSVCSSAPVAASQSRTVSSADPDTTCLPSGEKATDVTQPVWPSSVCSAAFQCACTFGFS